MYVKIWRGKARVVLGRKNHAALSLEPKWLRHKKNLNKNNFRGQFQTDFMRLVSSKLFFSGGLPSCRTTVLTFFLKNNLSAARRLATSLAPAQRLPQLLPRTEWRAKRVTPYQEHHMAIVAGGGARIVATATAWIHRGSVQLANTIKGILTKIIFVASLKSTLCA